MWKWLIVTISGLLFCSCVTQSDDLVAATLSAGVNLLNEEACQLPCFNNIVPGITTLDDALDIVETSSSFATDGDLIQYQTSDNMQVNVRLVRASPTSGAYVSRIELGFDESNQLTLSDIIDAGYLPTEVFRGNVAGPNALNLLLVFGQQQQIVAYLSTIEQVNTDTEINQIWLIAEQDAFVTLDDIRTIQGYDQQIEWLGYAPVDKYLSQGSSPQ